MVVYIVIQWPDNIAVCYQYALILCLMFCEMQNYHLVLFPVFCILLILKNQLFLWSLLPLMSHFSPHSGLDGVMVLVAKVWNIFLSLLGLFLWRWGLTSGLGFRTQQRSSWQRRVTFIALKKYFGCLFSPTRRCICLLCFVFLITYPLIHSWKQKCVDSEMTSDKVDELYLIDHDEIISHLTLKQEVINVKCVQKW